MIKNRATLRYFNLSHPIIVIYIFTILIAGDEKCFENSTETNASTDFLNYGEDDEMKITGYRKCRLRIIICGICFFLTAGLLRLFMHWRQHWLLLATHVACTLKVAEKVLVQEYFEGKYTIYYVEKVQYLGREKKR